jgi:hypothetical protein
MAEQSAHSGERSLFEKVSALDAVLFRTHSILLDLVERDYASARCRISLGSEANCQRLVRDQHAGGETDPAQWNQAMPTAAC